MVGTNATSMMNNSRSSGFGDFGGAGLKPNGEERRPASSSFGNAFGDFGSVGLTNGDDRQPASSSTNQKLGSGSKGWGSSIWGPGSLTSGFPSNSRDPSRTRENSSFRATGNDDVEGKTGSSSLVESSESDLWQSQRSAWNTTESASAFQQGRASGISPARHRIASTAPASHSLIGNSNSSSGYFPTAQGAAVGQQLTTKPSNRPFFEAGASSFTASDQSNAGISAFVGGCYSDAQIQKPIDNKISWNDAGSVHSPTDDRRQSLANSDYFGTTSTAGSRNGSLPPSRHGSEPVQFPAMTDAYSRFNQTSTAPRGHTSSLSSQPHARGYQERNNSIQSESLLMIGRLSIDDSQDQSLLRSRPPSNMLGNQYSQDQNYARQTLMNISQNSINSEEAAMNGAGSYTPDGYPSGQYNDQAFVYRPNVGNRGALTLSGVDYRQSPYYSTGGTPPMFDHLYPSRNDGPTRPLANGHSTVLDSKLRSLQRSQEQQYIHPQQFHQLIAGAQQFRQHYPPFAYGYPNSFQMNGMAPGIPLQSMGPMMHVLEAPQVQPALEDGEGIRSKLLEEFKSTNKSRRYELKDIYDHIAEFSGDQHGSRFIQQKLETANSDEKDRVFAEIKPNAMQLMTDVFGNYVIQKFFEHGDQSQKKILANKMKGQVLTLSLQMYGCRVVQKALEHILTDQQAALVRELENNVIKCVKDQNGNHVIQKAIERVPAEHIQFIIKAFNSKVNDLAMHGYGCRVIQRMLEHCEDPVRKTIMQELHSSAPLLIPDQYGNYVIQHVLQHGEPEDRERIVALVKAQLLPFSKHKFASNVVEKCLVYGTDADRREIMLKLVAKNDQGENSLVILIKDSYGNYVIQTLLDTLNAQDFAAFVDYLQPEMAKARRNTTGKQVMAVEKKMHRFEDRRDSLSDVHTRNLTNPNALRTSVSANATPPPPLTNDTQSPQSSSLPSTNNSTVEDPIHSTSSKGRPLVPEIHVADIS